MLAAGTGLYCAARSSVLWSQGAPDTAAPDLPQPPSPSSPTHAAVATDPTTVAGEDAGVAARTPGDAGPYYTMEEVARHCRPDDMWVVIDGEVYDVTQWLASHPGGSDPTVTEGHRKLGRREVDFPSEHLRLALETQTKSFGGPGPQVTNVFLTGVW